MKKYKLAALTSHPVQYQGPLFQKLANHPEIDLMVYFCWEAAIEKRAYDPEFGREIKWDVPLLEGYRCKFLENRSPCPSSEFWGQINFGIIKELLGYSGNNSVGRSRSDDSMTDESANSGSITGGSATKHYEAVIIFGWNSFTNWLAFFTAFLIGLPVFLRGENPLNQELLKPDWKIKIKKLILGWLFKRVAAFLHIGEENKKFYRFYGVPEEKLFFAPYAVDNDRFVSGRRALSAKRRTLRKDLGVKTRDAVILFAGKLIEKKRPMDLLKAYERLMTGDQRKNIHLLFVGDGALRPRLENYVKERNIKNVHFPGFKNQSEMPKYYVLSDILVLPSGAGETWGLAVNEAMCFGLVPIVSNLAGCGPDLIRQGENGYIFPLGDIDSLNEYLKDLVQNPQKRKKFGENSKKIIANYSYHNDIEGILTALRASVRS